MQKFTQKYAIVQLLENIDEGTEFSWRDWPLHVTLADVFAVDWRADELRLKLDEALQPHPRASSIAEDDMFFGPNKDVRVVLLKKTLSLLALHNDILDVLDQGGFIPNNPEYARVGYLPHSTVQRHARLAKGDSVVFNALTLIDMFPGGDPYQRKVLSTTYFAE